MYAYYSKHTVYEPVHIIWIRDRTYMCMHSIQRENFSPAQARQSAISNQQSAVSNLLHRIETRCFEPHSLPPLVHWVEANAPETLFSYLVSVIFLSNILGRKLLDIASFPSFGVTMAIHPLDRSTLALALTGILFLRTPQIVDLSRTLLFTRTPPLTQNHPSIHPGNKTPCRIHPFPRF